MRPLRPLLFATLMLLAAAPGLTALPAEVAGTPLPSLAPMLERVTPAVVNISTVSVVRAEANPLLRDPFFRWFFELPRDSQRKRSQYGRYSSSSSIMTTRCVQCGKPARIFRACVFCPSSHSGSGRMTLICQRSRLNVIGCGVGPSSTITHSTSPS